ncbi:pyruvate kinase [Halanaeroarchaeum sulfurireducens]|uniref:Pyruvate kinase n=1 Tax=Halanaeroarchaeum sulfurireducens TaxID=1604004 RepID=A0A0F7PAB2_9EURY|nr:pyruvate kinase [Halanaeroarchaeum sulfurireducens]AKH97135.1 pyruvate kinase [Halanaeroarchaeum sulfurireducens]ALG81536.1 pyruvate kinase [Halanaeroarchaeum sulfurireducens]
MRKAKIVCTLGPASDSIDTLQGLANAGMSVARVNASHGTREERAALIDRARRVDGRTDGPIAVMVDLQGPEVRTGETDGEITLHAGDSVRFEPGRSVTADRIGLSTDISAVDPGDQVLIDDGRIETTVDHVDGKTVVATVDVGGEMTSHKGVNVPGVALDLDVVTEKDELDLELAAEKDVDFVAASFVRDAADVLAVSEYLESLGAEIPVIAKIERAGAVENCGEIIATAHGVMVARGDLGVELPMEDVPLIQKRIIRQAQAAGTPVITATEMLDSMVHRGRPTRAEASDVANAVLDGTDAVMLSAETAVGDHPVTVVRAMDRIVRTVEASGEYDEIQDQRVPPADEGSRTEAVARSARYLARDVDASAVVVASESGYTARRVAKFRPGVPVVATTPRDDVRRQLALVWGVDAQLATLPDGSAASVIDRAVQTSVEADVVESGDTVVVLSGMMTALDSEDTTNTLKVHVAAETLATGRAVVDGRATGPVARLTDGDLSSVPSGAIAVLGADFDEEFDGDPTRLAGMVSARSGMTGYAAMIAREVGVPMVSGADMPHVEDGTVVTVDGERGVVYSGEVAGQ